MNECHLHLFLYMVVNYTDSLMHAWVMHWNPFHSWCMTIATRRIKPKQHQSKRRTYVRTLHEKKKIPSLSLSLFNWSWQPWHDKKPTNQLMESLHGVSFIMIYYNNILYKNTITVGMDIRTFSSGLLPWRWWWQLYQSTNHTTVHRVSFIQDT